MNFFTSFFLKRNCSRLLIAAILLFSTSLKAQTWAFRGGYGANGADKGTSVCTDASGNVYMAGSYASSSITFGSFTLNWTAANDAFVVKFNSSGVAQWAIPIASTGNDFATGIATDGTSVYVTGTYSNTMNVNGAGGYATSGGNDGYVVKLNATTGATTWVTTFGGGSSDSPQSIVVDPSGNVYVSGFFFSAPATFGSFSKSPTGGSGSDIFLLQLTSAGTINWASTGGATTNNDNAAGSSVCYDAILGEIILVGGTNSASGSSCTYGSVNFTSTGGNDIVLLEVTASNGTFVSGKVVGGTATEDALASCYDSSTGDVFLSGYYGSGSITFGGTTLTNSGSGTEDIFYARYNPSTDVFTWAKSAGANSTGSDRARSICSDGSGGIIIGGVISPGTSNFPTASSPLTLSNTRTTGGDPFLVRVDAATGNATWAQMGSADNTTSTENAFNAIAYSSGAVWGTGVYTSNITFGSLGALANVTGTLQDALLARLTAPPPLTATQSQVNLTCNGVCTGSATVVVSGGTSPYTYSWSPSGGSGATASSLCATNYTVTITDAASASITKTFNITQPPAIVTTPVSQTNVSCFGGSNGAASLTASGGTGTLTYNWTPGTPTGDGTGSVTGLTAQTWTCTVTDANTCTTTRTFTITAPPAIATTAASQTNVSCFGGSNGAATISVSGGTPGYTYDWTPGTPTGDGTASVTGLTAQTYTCTVTDANGCTATRAFTITAPPAITPTAASQTNVSCFGGSNGAASVSVSGGTPGYTYDWTPGTPTGDGTASVTGLTAQTYTCTVTDANGCTATRAFTITAPPAIATTAASQTNVSCFGGSNGAGTISVSGGTPGYTYDWTPGTPTGDGTVSVTGLTAQTYTCTVTDANGCTATRAFTITAPPAIVVSVVSQTNVSCFGGSNGGASVSVTGGTPGYTYDWTPGTPTGDGTASVTGLTAQTYTCTVTDANGCTATRTLNITQPTTAVSGTTVVTNVACFGGSNGAINLTPSGGTPGYTFNWLPSGPTTEDRTGLTAGTYTVQITDANGCTGTVNATVTQPTAPVSGTTVVSNVSCFGNSNGAIDLTPTGGTTGYTYNWLPSGPTTEDRTGLTAGTYTVQITDINGCTGTVNATVTEPAAVSAPTASSNSPVCTGNTINLSTPAVAGATYSWTGPSSFSSSVQNPSRTGATVAMAGTYSITVTVGGCTSAVGTTSVVVNATPATPTASSNSPVCTGNTINLSTPAVAGATYSWTGPSSFSSSVQNPSRTGATVAMAGTYSITVTTTGCTSAVGTTAVVINATPATPTASSNSPVCTGNTINLSTPAVAGATYSWTGPSSFSSSVQNPSRTGATVAMAGTYSVTVTTTGCTSAVGTTAVVINATPATPTASSNSPVCTGNTINLSTPAVAGATYSWTGPSSFSSSVQNPSRTGATVAMAGTYSVTVTTTGCTSAVGTTAVVINATPATPTASSNSPVCTGNTINLSTPAVAGATYSWTGPSSFSSSVQNPSRTGATVAMAGTYSVTVTTTGCTSAVGTTAVAVNQSIALTTSQTEVSCNGGSNGTASVTATGGTGTLIYDWTPGTPTGDGTNAVTGLIAGSYTLTVTDATSCSATATFNITEPPAITATVVHTDVTCNGICNGSATVTPTGGTPGYTYSWMPSGGTNAAATGLCPGTYTCTITDANGCNFTTSITIGQPPAIVVTATSTGVTCNGLCNGTATVVASGGTSGYIYSWAPSGGTSATATGLCPGTYTCTVTDANGCTATQTVTIIEPPALTATVTSTDVTCNAACNGTATISVSGGTSPYTYAWTPSGGTASTATGLCAGTYTCTVTDANGCTITQTVTITEPAALVVTATSTDVTCNGACNGSADITATGGTAPYTYTWIPGGSTVSSVTGLCAGTYTCTVTDANGCTATQVVIITEPPVLTASSTATTILCNGGTADVTISAAGGTPSYSGTGTVTGVTAGTYTYTVTDANGCSATTSITITEPAAITGTQAFTVCAGQSVTVGSNIYNSTGIYTDILPAFNSCDSTVTTDLTVLPANAVSQTFTVCPGGSVVVGSNTYTVSGTYTDVLTAFNGCDSTVTTNLTVLTANTASQTLTVCAGQSVTVGSNVYDTTGTYTDVLVSAAGCDSTLTTDLTVLPANTASQTLTVCAGQSVMVGSNIYTTSGTYTDTVTAFNGCDSTVTTNLTVLPAIDVTVTVAANTATAATGGASYQWLDCDNGNVVIAGETNQSFTAIAAGNYAIAITVSGCMDTSTCVNIVPEGIADHAIANNVMVYPNPATEMVTVQVENLKAGTETVVSLYDGLGKLVYSAVVTSEKTNIDLSKLSKGIYFIKLQNATGVVTKKITKE